MHVLHRHACRQNIHTNMKISKYFFLKKRKRSITNVFGCFPASAKILIVCFCCHHYKTSSALNLDHIILETNFNIIFKVVIKHKMLVWLVLCSTTEQRPVPTPVCHCFCVVKECELTQKTLSIRCSYFSN